MTKKTKAAGTKPKTKSKAKPTADAKPSEVRPVISQGKIQELMRACRVNDKSVAKTNGSTREAIGYAKKNHHLNTEVFSLVRKLDKKEPEELRDYLDDLDHQLDVSGLRDRASKATARMDFGEGGEAAEGDEDEGDEDQGNVTSFPAAAAGATVQ